jgi:hypothetical protein
MKLATAVLLSVVLLTGAVAVTPSASATTCHTDPEELEPVACGAVLAALCIMQNGGNVKTVRSCVL